MNCGEKPMNGKIVEGCGRCRFWHRLDPDAGSGIDSDGNYNVTEYGTGRCRRFPPSGLRRDLAQVEQREMLDSMDAAGAAFWPVTWAEDWCGEYVAALALVDGGKAA